MKHARADYNRIQDPLNLIPDDEPVFLLRAQDVTSPSVVEYWATLAKYSGADSRLVQRARDFADVMREWQTTKGAKIPDAPEFNLE